MGIEKYFQVKGASSSSSTPAKPKETKPAAPAKKTTPARKRKAAGDADNDDNDDDFQAAETPTKSKYFNSTEKKIDPKSFFGSTKASTSKPVETKPVEKKPKEEPKPKKQVEEESKPAPRKARAKAIVIEDSEDEYEDNGKDDDEDNFIDDEEDEGPALKKAKRSTSFEESKKTAKKATPAKKAAAQTKTEETEEAPKKKNNYFAKLKTQEGPRSLGTRPEPVGASNCLDGLTFVISGQYETLTRDQTKSIIMRYGGRVTGGVSGKTDYLAMGRDAGESKIAKAKSLGTKVLDEDAFYKLVESSAPKEVEYVPPPKPKGKGKESDSVLNTTVSKTDHATQLWTEKYKPQKLEEIIGNKQIVKNISEWLGNWQENFKKGFAGEGDSMMDYKALLLSGPPGIGKTTTANVVARLNGYEPLEFNASDVRSKKVLEASITEMMDNRTMTEFFQPASKESKKAEPKLLQGKKVVLIMDEVDGMSGGDRGGSVQLASLIRASKIPVICICNDSRSDKVTPLQRVCYEAKYKRTPAAQIRSRILSIAFKEQLKIAPNAVDELVAATNNDIRQIINILSTYRLNQSNMDYDQAKAVGKNNEKNSILGLFDIPLELFSNTSWTAKSLSEKADIYFHDYALAHLMSFENYLRCSPTQAAARDGNPNRRNCNEMDLIAKAADAMADGDLVDSMIHGTVQHYSLMPVHSIFSCVRPASYMRGSIQSRIMFPSWLGQNSKAGKFARQLSDVQTRMRLKASGDKFEIRQNYIPTLNDRIFGYLKEEKYNDAMEYMDNYYLDRENLDVLSELTFSSKPKGPITELSTKVKSTFTRQYNAKNHPILFQLSGEPIKKAVSAGPKEDAEGTLIEEDGATFGEDVSEEEQDMEDDPEKDLQSIKFIKEATPKKRKTAAASGSGAKKQRTKK